MSSQSKSLDGANGEKGTRNSFQKTKEKSFTFKNRHTGIKATFTYDISTFEENSEDDVNFISADKNNAQKILNFLRNI